MSAVEYSQPEAASPLSAPDLPDRKAPQSQTFRRNPVFLEPAVDRKCAVTSNGVLGELRSDQVFLRPTHSKLGRIAPPGRARCAGGVGAGCGCAGRSRRRTSHPSSRSRWSATHVADLPTEIHCQSAGCVPMASATGLVAAELRSARHRPDRSFPAGGSGPGGRCDSSRTSLPHPHYECGGRRSLGRRQDLSGPTRGRSHWPVASGCYCPG
jgi:hypothetical protein